MTAGATATAGRARPPIVAFRNLSKTFGSARVLDRVDFRVEPGEVHCLLGHNGSGKSTLIKILGGVLDPDPGSLLAVNDDEQPLPMTPGRVHGLGIRFVHQSLGLIPDLTVAEHLAQDRVAGRVGWYMARAATRRAAAEALDSLAIAVDPDATVRSLPPVERALVAIARALSSLSRRPGGTARCLLVLDEPTAFLPREEVARLFDVARRIAASGAGVILVTHDTDEVLSIADRVTVLRDGAVAGERSRQALNRTDLVRLIVGHAIADRPADRGQAVREPQVEARVERSGALRGTVLAIGRGEILGATGLIGSGYADLAYALFGGRAARGSLRLGRQRFDLAQLTPARAMRAGIALIPSDRPGAAAALDLSVAENAAVTALARFANPLFVTRSRLERGVTPMLEQGLVRPMSPMLDLGRLSGGNQQKVILAKWLATKPLLLLLDEPTQGIDVGAREQIFETLRALAASGASILCASTDHEQLAELCHRVLILSGGRVAGELGPGPVTAQAIGQAVLGGAGLAA